MRLIRSFSVALVLCLILIIAAVPIMACPLGQRSEDISQRQSQVRSSESFTARRESVGRANVRRGAGLKIAANKLRTAKGEKPFT
jgi:hypothetical protein